MFKRDWNLYAAIGIIISILTVGIINNPNYQNRQNQTQSDTKGPSNIGDKKLHAPPIYSITNIGNSFKFTGLYSGFNCYLGARDEEYYVCVDRENIKATQQTAMWSLATLIVGIIGSWFVIQSLRLNANANEISAQALKIAILQNRPWIMMKMVEKATWQPPSQNTTIGTLHFEFTCQNVGNGPATNIYIWSEIVDMANAAEIRRALHLPETTTGNRMPILFPQDEPLTARHGLLVERRLFDMAPDGRFGVAIGAEYNIPGDVERKIMHTLYQVFVTTQVKMGKTKLIQPGVYLVPKSDQAINPT